MKQKYLSRILITVIFAAAFFSCKQNTAEPKTKLSSNADLLNISFSADMNDFYFDANKTDYDITVKNNKTQKLKCMAVSDDVRAKVVISPKEEVTLKTGSANTFKIFVTAEDGVTKKTYTVNVNVDNASNNESNKSSNAFLKSLSVYNANLKQYFDKNSFDYSAVLIENKSEVEVSAVPEDDNALIEISPKGLTHIAAGEKKLFTVTVTSENKKTVKEYKVTVERLKKAETPADLLDIVLSAGKLSPLFESSITEYDVEVENSVSEIEVKGIPKNPAAAVTVTPSGKMALIVDAKKEFSINVSVNGNTKVYKVNVLRSAPKSNNADLNSLTVTDDDGKSFTLSPVFDKDTLAYTAEIPLNHKSVITLVGQKDDVKAKLHEVAAMPSIFAKEAGSEQRLSLTVTAEAGNTKTYTVLLKRSAVPTYSSDAALKALSLADDIGGVIKIDPIFSSSTLIYTAEVPYNFSKGIKLSYLLSDTAATAVVKAQPETLEAGSGATQVFTVTVTAEDSTTKQEYKITVTRTAADENAYLKNIELIVDEDLNNIIPFKEGSFNKDVLNYTAEVRYGTKWVRLRWTKDSIFSSIEPSGVMSAVEFTPGMVLTITVTAQSGKKNIYTVTINEEVSVNNYKAMVPVITKDQGPQTVVGNQTEGVFITGRTVVLQPYSMGECEITFRTWKEVYDWAKGKGYIFNKADQITPGSMMGTTDPDEPACGVSWMNAVIWCNAYSEKENLELVYKDDQDKVIKASLSADRIKMDITKNGYRLPTEAEWEFAARGGDPSASDWNFKYAGTDGEDIPGYGVYPNNHAWTLMNSKEDGNRKTHKPKMKSPNKLNIYDMSGNVLEWVWDIYAGITPSTPADGNAYFNNSKRVRRGGVCFAMGLMGPQLEEYLKGVGRRQYEVSWRESNDKISSTSKENGFRVVYSVK